MKLLIDIGHPAHVHYFKNLANYFINQGGDVLFTVRNKEVAVQLLEFYNFKYFITGKPYKSKVGKVFGLIWFTINIFIRAIKFKPDFILNFTFYSAFTAFLLRKPHISIEDTFNKESLRLIMPFTNVVFTGEYPHISLGPKEIRYNGYQELAYLHPDYFTPNPSILQKLNISSDEKYFILRFVSWNASHDYGQKGLTNQEKIELVNLLNRFGKVFISSEGELDEFFEEYKIDILPSEMHDILYYASLYIGEGATMTTESAVLGTPAFYINTQKTGPTTELEDTYGLVYNFQNFDQLPSKIEEVLKTPDFNGLFKERAKSLITEKVNLTKLLIWFIENWPESKKIMKENPNYQYKFK